LGANSLATVVAATAAQPLGEVTLEIGAIAFGTKWNDLAISDLKLERCVD
jgi:hypothetical protein